MLPAEGENVTFLSWIWGMALSKQLQNHYKAAHLDHADGSNRCPTFVVRSKFKHGNFLCCFSQLLAGPLDVPALVILEIGFTGIGIAA